MQKRTRYLQIGVLICSILLIGFGILRGEAEEICAKAVKLCLECIGIG